MAFKKNTLTLLPGFTLNHKFLIQPFTFFTLLIEILVLSPSTSLATPYQARPIAKFNDVVWGLAFISEHELLVTERSGALYFFNTKTKIKKRLLAPAVFAEGQSGLLDIHHHTFLKKTYIYFTFTEKYQNLFTTSLARGVYKDGKVSKIKTLFRAKIYGNSSRHFGSRLAFQDQMIFMTIGDRGSRKYAQNLSYHNGKILRLTLDGKAAPENPFANTPNALPEIWSLGHRNPQGIAINTQDQSLYSVEFGPRGGDEFNFIQPQKNYGWPTITYGKEYWGPKIGPTHKKGLEQPIAQWTPSISPSGLLFYSSETLPKWKNSFFVASLGGQHLRRLKVSQQKVTFQEALFKELGERIRHVRQSPEGYIYFTTDSGKIYKIEKK